MISIILMTAIWHIDITCGEYLVCSYPQLCPCLCIHQNQANNSDFAVTFIFRSKKSVFKYLVLAYYTWSLRHVQLVSQTCVNDHVCYRTIIIHAIILPVLGREAGYNTSLRNSHLKQKSETFINIKIYLKSV